MKKFINIIMMAVVCALGACTPEPDEYTEVTAENYALAESQIIFQDYVKRAAAVTGTNGMGVFFHSRTAPDPADRTIMRINFDTRYSFAVIDLSHDATLTMPETGGRYQSAWFVTEEHYNPMAITAPGTYTLTQEAMGSRYVLLVIRTQVNMKDDADMKTVDALQDALVLSQSDRGEYIVTNNWDVNEVLAMRAYYQALAVEKHISTSEMFGKKGEVSLENHNCGAACGWGGFTPDQAVYLDYRPANANPCTLVMKDVPVADNAFWSVTIYDAEGYPQGDPFNVNSAFAKYEEDGTVVLHMGGDSTADNYLDIFEGWTFILRLYLPQEAYFNGTWTQPELQY